MWVFYFLIVAVSRQCLAVGSITDLSWEFNNRTIFWPGQRPFEFTKVVAETAERGYWYAVNEFCTAEHGGTHFDAPYHFNKNGWKVSEVPVSRLYATGALVDLRNKTPNAEAELTVNDLQSWEERNGPFANGSVLIVKFGRSQYWNNKTKYLELDANNQMNFPGVSKEAAKWIVDTGKFYGVGIDTPSIDPGRSVDLMAHRIFSANLLYHLENVKLVTELPERGFDLIVAPMKLEGGTGAPVRIFAIINNN